MSLYLDHFGLNDAPFRITPNTEFFFAGANRGPTLKALLYAVTQEEGIIKITGEVGSGKTMLCRMLLEQLPESVETVYLANPSLSRLEILGAIADELRITPPGAEDQNNHSLLRHLQTALVERYAAGKRVVVLIDEAHAMPAESLEEIRLLSNLESNHSKLLQIVLFGQPELDVRLLATDMRQLRERITHHFNLDPLQSREVADYLDVRLRAAGYRGPNPFSRVAIQMIARASQGLTRRINILADKAMLAAFADNTHNIHIRQVRTAMRDARFGPLPGSRTAWQPLALGLVLALVVGVLLWWMMQRWVAIQIEESKPIQAHPGSAQPLDEAGSKTRGGPAGKPKPH